MEKAVGHPTNGWILGLPPAESRGPGGGSSWVSAGPVPVGTAETFTADSQRKYDLPMFKEALQGMVDGAEGGTAGLLMAFEGIPIESYSKGD